MHKPAVSPFILIRLRYCNGPARSRLWLLGARHARRGACAVAGARSPVAHTSTPRPPRVRPLRARIAGLAATLLLPSCFTQALVSCFSLLGRRAAQEVRDCGKKWSPLATRLPAARNRARAASAHLPPAAARPPQDRATTVLNFGGRSDVLFLGIFDGTVGDFAGPSDLSGGSARALFFLSLPTPLPRPFPCAQPRLSTRALPPTLLPAT